MAAGVEDIWGAETPGVLEDPDAGEENPAGAGVWDILIYVVTFIYVEPSGSFRNPLHCRSLSSI